MNDDQLSATTAPVGPEDSNRLDRRKAMKAALGGAAAGAVFVAPKVAGFSVAPDYAAAATCTTQSTSLGSEQSTNAIYCSCIYYFTCWGNDALSCNCNNVTKTASVNVRGTTINADVVLKGSANSNTGNAGCHNFDSSSSVTLTGFDSNNVGSCTVNWNISGTSNNTAENGGVTFNANGNQTPWIRHSSNNNDRRTVNLTLACNC